MDLTLLIHSFLKILSSKKFIIKFMSLYTVYETSQPGYVRSHLELGARISVKVARHPAQDGNVFANFTNVQYIGL